jgi:hypothetical protein
MLYWNSGFRDWTQSSWNQPDSSTLSHFYSFFCVAPNQTHQKKYVLLYMVFHFSIQLSSKQSIIGCFSEFQLWTTKSPIHWQSIFRQALLQILHGVMSNSLEKTCSPSYGLQLLYKHHSPKFYGLATNELQNSTLNTETPLSSLFTIWNSMSLSTLLWTTFSTGSIYF